MSDGDSATESIGSGHLEDRRDRIGVLHVIDPASPDGGPCTLRLLADVIGCMQSARHDVLIVGSASDVAQARACCIEPAGSMCPPRSLPFAGQRALGRYLKYRRMCGRGDDLVHAWTARTAGLAAQAARRIPRLATLHVGPASETTGFASRYYIRAMERSNIAVLAASTSVEREYRMAGLSRQRSALMPPAVDPNSPALLPRQVVRASWPVYSSTFVVGLLSAPARWPDARAAATSAGRVVLSGRKVRLVLHPSAFRRIEAEAFLGCVSLRDLLILDESADQPWRIVNGLDAVVVPCPHRAAGSCASMLPILWSMAAGVPVIAEAPAASKRASASNGQERGAKWGGWGGSDVIEDGVNGMIIDPHDVNAASDRVAKLYDDREVGLLGRRLTDAARAAVDDAFHINAYCMRLRHAYELLLARGTTSERTQGVSVLSEVR